MEAKFKNLFARFYERVSAKDRLEGLTDEELINEIGATPKRIKKKTKDLLNFLQKHDATATLVEGKVKVTGNLPKDVTRFLEESPYVKMAILNRELNYEKPRHTVNVSWSSQTKKVLKSRVELRRLIPMSFTKEEEDQLKMTKRKDF